MRRHEPCVVWSLRADRQDYVRTTPDGLFLYVNGTQVKLDRRTARLLARRIDQCLTATNGNSRVTESGSGPSAKGDS